MLVGLAVGVWPASAPVLAWALDVSPAVDAAACDAPWRTWAALERGSVTAAPVLPCAAEVASGARGAALWAALGQRARPASHRRAIARVLLAAGPAEAVLASAAVDGDLRRGLLDEATIAHASDDLVALASRYPLGGLGDRARVYEALATGSAAEAGPVLAEWPRDQDLRAVQGLVAGLPGLGPATSPPPTLAGPLADYMPVGEALAEHVAAEWSAVRDWVAAGASAEERARRAMVVLVGEAPGEPWMSVHALLRGERVVPVLVGLAAVDLGAAAALPVRVRGDEWAVLAGVGHLAVYAPACGPRRLVALPGLRPSPDDWGTTAAAQLGRARVLADAWLTPCEAAAP